MKLEREFCDIVDKCAGDIPRFDQEGMRIYAYTHISTSFLTISEASGASRHEVTTFQN